MTKDILPFASYSLWTDFEALNGKTCHMQRGFSRAFFQDRRVAGVVRVTSNWQKIGHLAQQGIWEFSQQPRLLQDPRGVRVVADRLFLYYESEPVARRVEKILANYHSQPWLQNSHIIEFDRGDAGVGKSWEIVARRRRFLLYGTIDCAIDEGDVVRILDFKTGKSDGDMRQALVYLLLATVRHPDRRAILNFIYLEKGTRSRDIYLPPADISKVRDRLAAVAYLHQRQLAKYRQRDRTDTNAFSRIFPPNPGINCRFCRFRQSCNFCE